MAQHRSRIQTHLRRRIQADRTPPPSVPTARTRKADSPLVLRTAAAPVGEGPRVHTRRRNRQAAPVRSSAPPVSLTAAVPSGLLLTHRVARPETPSLPPRPNPAHPPPFIPSQPRVGPYLARPHMSSVLYVWSSILIYPPTLSPWETETNDAAVHTSPERSRSVSFRPTAAAACCSATFPLSVPHAATPRPTDILAPPRA